MVVFEDLAVLGKIYLFSVGAVCDRHETVLGEVGEARLGAKVTLMAS